jgi:hypothetical protein
MKALSLLVLVLLASCGRDEVVYQEPQSPTVVYNRGGHHRGYNRWNRHYRPHHRRGHGRGPWRNGVAVHNNNPWITGAPGSSHGMGTSSRPGRRTGTHRLIDARACEGLEDNLAYSNCLDGFESSVR